MCFGKVCCGRVCGDGRRKQGRDRGLARQEGEPRGCRRGCVGDGGCGADGLGKQSTWVRLGFCTIRSLSLGRGSQWVLASRSSLHFGAYGSSSGGT